MSDKKNFVLRIDMKNYKALEKWAADEFRSVNAQIEYLLDKAIKENRRTEVKKEPNFLPNDQHQQGPTEDSQDQESLDGPDSKEYE